ncbi:hypothetical protein D9757_004172 [Collybiopsis confluens]|uniref:ADF-H domain-containing protein n=1 Tax=Collybiopsis confluens TaxID=2823264 RepID=A0A8H5MCQ7_9AGAR|nr:hypothetical protein D9757_004172 [Collybiopsis confluens]
MNQKCAAVGHLKVGTGAKALPDYVRNYFQPSTSMADVTDSKINDAYLDVRDDKKETKWLLLDYKSDDSDKLTLTQTGTGGLDELREALDDARASFAYIRVSYNNDKESVREKFVLVVRRRGSSPSAVFVFSFRLTLMSFKWIGPKCKAVMRKAKISVHSADVKQVLRVYSIEVAAREKDDLSEDPIVKRLRKAGGASYDGV